MIAIVFISKIIQQEYDFPKVDRWDPITKSFCPIAIHHIMSFLSSHQFIKGGLMPNNNSSFITSHPSSLKDINPTQLTQINIRQII